MREQDAK